MRNFTFYFRAIIYVIVTAVLTSIIYNLFVIFSLFATDFVLKQYHNTSFFWFIIIALIIGIAVIGFLWNTLIIIPMWVLLFATKICNYKKVVLITIAIFTGLSCIGTLFYLINTTYTWFPKVILCIFCLHLTFGIIDAHRSLFTAEKTYNDFEQ